MATSAFGDEIPDDPVAPGPAARQPQPAPTRPQVSAFGDPLSAFGDALDDEPAQPVQPAPAQPVPGGELPNRTAGQWTTDVGAHIGRGAYGLFDTLAGVGDLATGGAVTPWLQSHGLDSQKARAALDAEMSPQALAQRKEVEDAQGFAGTAGAVLRNPAYAAGAIIESVPQMVAGGVAGRGIAAGARLAGAAPGLAGALGTGAGEGLAAAGQQAAQTVQRTGDLTPGQTGLALLSGGMTGLLGAAGARIGRALGIGDIDAVMAGQGGADVAKSLVNRALAGTGVESLEELSQSAQQQVLTNLATGRPAMEGVANAAGQGAVLGGLMGGGVNLTSRPNMNTPAEQPAVPPAAPVDPRIEAARAAVPGAIRNYLNPEQATPAPAAPPTPPRPAPQPSPQPVPFAGSRDITPLLDNLGVEGEQRTRSLDLLRPSEQDIEARRRGVVTMDEQRRLANLIGLDGAQALAHGRKLGETFNAEQFRAVTSAVQSQMTNVLELQQKIVNGQATDLERAQFVDDVSNMRRTTGELLGARAEAGRALAAQRRQVQDINQARAIVESIGGFSGADDLATAIGAAIQSGGLQNAAKVIHKGNHITDYIKAGWLYDPTTHIANAIGNTGMIGVNVMDRTNAAILAGAKRMFGLKGETVWSEPVALLSGAIRGQMKAFAAGANAFAKGESPLLGSGKLEESRLPQRTMPGAKGTVKLAFDNTALLSFRALSAADGYFAVTGYESELRAQAHRIASQEKRTGSLQQGVKLSDRIEQLVQNPTPEMIETAGDMARESTFNAPAGPWVAKVIAARATMPWLNILTPFIKSPAQIVKRALKSSPAGALAPSVWRDVAKGGKVQEMALARIATGTQIMIAAGMLAQAGFLNGSGPSDEKERKAWLAAGNQPYSVKVDGQWYGINRLDPFAMWAAMASDITHMWNDREKDTAEQTATRLVSSFAENVVNKSWFSGVQRLAQALGDPQRYMGSFVQQTVASVLQPNALVANIASRQDPFARKPEGLADTLANRIPGLRESVPARQDAWGQPQANIRQADNLFNALVPMTHSKESEDPVRQEAARLGWTPGEPRDFFSVPSKVHGQRGTRYQMTAEQHREFLEMTGARIHAAASQQMRRREWESMDDDTRRAMLDRITRSARKAAREAFVPYLDKGKRGLLDLYRKQTAAMARSKK